MLLLFLACGADDEEVGTGGLGDADAAPGVDGGSGVDGASGTDAGLQDSGAVEAAGQEGGTEAGPPPVGPLEELPSAPGSHIVQIEALGENEWLSLGPPEADPLYGVARGRSWGGRAFVLAPELRGAFYTGEGVHAYVKPDGRIMDDIFVYDINKHRWIAVYPGTDTTTFNEMVETGALSIDDNAQVVDSEGNPVPIHTLIHAWDFLTYDTKARRFAWIAGDGLGRYYLGGLDIIEEGVAALEEQRESKTRPPMSPWFYDTTTGTFDRFPIENGKPDVGGFSAFYYLPSSNQYFNGGSQGVAYFDPETNRWTREEDHGPRPPGYDHGIAYDPVRERIYMGSGTNDPTGGLYIYDIGSATWTKPESKGPAPGNFRTNGASVFYDSANDLLVIFHYADSLIYVYEPDENSWSTLTFPSDVKNAVSYPSHNAFYDPELNAYFVFVAGDSRDNGTMWVYRFR